MNDRSRERRSLPVLPAAPEPVRGDGPGVGVRGGGVRRGGGPGEGGTDGSGGRASDAPGTAAAPSGRSAAAVDSPARVRVGLVTLGCDKNTVDSERIMARLFGEGAEVSGSIEDADVVVVNTCGFIETAKEESIDTMLEAARLKEAGGVRAVVAMGCLVQRYRDELEAEIPEIDLFLGLAEADRLVPELRERGLLPKPGDFVPNMERPLRLLTTRTPHTSHLKISEGCDHSCAFCAIPLMRGKFRSTPIERLVREARELEAQGVVELNLVSQDTTWYGRDWLRGHAPDEEGEFFMGRFFEGMPGPRPGAGSGAVEPGRSRARVLESASASEQDSGTGTGGREPRARARARRPRSGDGSGIERGRSRARGAGGARPRSPNPAVPGANRRGHLPDLLTALLDGTNVPWLRLFYMYPSGIYPELVELIAREHRIVPYLDMPIQHGSDAVLERMRRPERRATILERVRWLRDAVPDLALRSTVIVGFPGETEPEFEAMLELLEEVRFDHLGAFTYSIEEGTRAAAMSDQVPETVKRERLERVLDLQRGISLERNEAWVGRETEVLVDRRAREHEPGELVGRTVTQAYEIDGVVFLDRGEDATGGGAPRGNGDEGAAGRDAPATAPRASATVEPGRFVRARITGADERDLFGVMVDEDVEA